MTTQTRTVYRCVKAADLRKGDVIFIGDEKHLINGTWNEGSSMRITIGDPERTVRRMLRYPLFQMVRLADDDAG